MYREIKMSGYETLEGSRTAEALSSDRIPKWKFVLGLGVFQGLLITAGFYLSQLLYKVWFEAQSWLPARAELLETPVAEVVITGLFFILISGLQGWWLRRGEEKEHKRTKELIDRMSSSAPPNHQ